MRALDKKEMTKRGCVYCMDVAKECFPDTLHPKCKKWACPYEECPYHELDDFDSYSQYLKSSEASSLKRILHAMFDIEKEI